MHIDRPMLLPVMKPFYILFLFVVCLLTSEGSSLWIINGREARVNSRPYMALIILKNKSSEMICGGSLISANWVLTAAHCEMPEGKTEVILGAHSRNQKKNEDGRQRFDVEQSINHPEYNRSVYDNDIQLIKLSRRATIGEKVNLLDLPKTYEDVEAKTVCGIAGWGQIEQNKLADVLMEVNVSAISRSECSKRGYVKFRDVNKLCTSAGSKGQNACGGDSGGPLICGGIFKGIVSHGDVHCNKTDGATVYTRLTEKYVDWINKYTRQ